MKLFILGLALLAVALVHFALSGLPHDPLTAATIGHAPWRTGGPTVQEVIDQAIARGDRLNDHALWLIACRPRAALPGEDPYVCFATSAVMASREVTPP